ncbi:hypothetical protein SEA_GALACTICA_78 [Streptomyces phage Galactica]|nr:hypothetical protein SEA_GALACTICA_78 [Streptomyces phage Galactica]
MVGSLIGSAVVWGLVTLLTGGNWQAGLVVGLVVLAMCVKGVRAQQAAAAEAEWVMVRREPEQPKGWF